MPFHSPLSFLKSLNFLSGYQSEKSNPFPTIIISSIAIIAAYFQSFLTSKMEVFNVQKALHHHPKTRYDRSCLFNAKFFCSKYPKNFLLYKSHVKFFTNFLCFISRVGVYDNNFIHNSTKEDKHFLKCSSSLYVMMTPDNFIMLFYISIHKPKK